MKKLLVVAVMMFGFTIYSSAQPTPDSEKKITQRDKQKLKTELGLNTEQSKELQTINKDFKDKTNVIRSDESLSREDKRARLKKLNEERKEKVNTILTPEQQQKVTHMKKVGHRSKGQKKNRSTK